MAKLTGNESFIQVATGEYPLSFFQVRRKMPNVIFGSEVTTEQVASMGFEVVHPAERPVGDVVAEVQPAKVDGIYKQQFDVRSFTNEELDLRLQQKKQNLLSLVNNKLMRDLQKGFAYDFGGEHGVLHVQLRDSDRANLTGMRAMAVDFPEKAQPFRTYENVIVMLTSQQVVAMAQAAHSGYLALLSAVWGLKDQIERAATEAELPEVPVAD